MRVMQQSKWVGFERLLQAVSGESVGKATPAAQTMRNSSRSRRRQKIESSQGSRASRAGQDINGNRNGMAIVPESKEKHSQ